MKTLAIGDTHGECERLKKLVSVGLSYEPNDVTRIVFIGDYIDRGPDSKGVIDYVRKLSEDFEVIALMGNHEQMLWQAYYGDNHDQYEWKASYGHTCTSFGVEEIYDIPREYIDWMKERPYFFHDGLRTFVHAGIQRTLDLNMRVQSPQYMVWARDEFMFDMRKAGGFVVHGHTPQFNPWPDHRGNRLNLDTAAVFGNDMTAAIFNDTDVRPTHFVNEHGACIEATFKPNATELRLQYDQGSF